MSKVVKVVAVVALAAVVVIAAPYIAAFIAPALGAISASLTVATITSAIVGMGLSLGLGAIATLFRKVPDLTQSLVDRLRTDVGPTAPRKIVFGRTAAGADVRFQETHDLPNSKKDGFSQVVALASHRIHSVQSIHLDEQLSWSNGVIQGGYRDAIRTIRVVNEGVSGGGFPIPGTLWNSTAMSFTGCAYYQITFKLDPEVLSQGAPSRRVVKVEGCPVYDPRLDSTRGGSGSHRIDNQASWAYYNGSTEIGRNPALCLLTFMLGYRINGKLVWGMGLPAHRINFTNFAFYANLCEEQVATKGGGTVQRYTCDGIFSTTDAHQTVISGITAAMGSCILTDTSGVYQLVGGYDDTAEPTIHFTADDLIGPTEWRAVPPPRERFNIVRGRFISEAEQFQLADWGEIETDPLPDGYDRVMTLDLGCVSRPETAQRIAKQFILREAKTPGLFEAVFGPRGFLVEVGSLCTISGHRGWNGKLFRVVKQSEAHDMIYQMTLREESSEVYAWDKDEEKPLPDSVRPPAWNPADTIAPENLQVSSDTKLAGDGVNRVSFLTITWTPEESGRVRTIQIRAKSLGQTDYSTITDRYSPTAGILEQASPVPGVAVTVEARFIMSTGVASPWVSAERVAENSVVVDGTARDAAGAAQDDADKANKGVKDTSDAIIVHTGRISEAVDLIEGIRGVVSLSQDAISRTKDLVLLDTQAKVDQLWTAVDETGMHITQLETTLVQRNNQAVAAYNQKIRVLTDGLTAEVTAREQLAAKTESSLGEAIAAIDEERIARADGDGDTLASIRDTLSVGLENAGGLTLEQKLVATGNAVQGFNGSYSLAINNNGHISGFALNSAPNGVSKFAIMASEIAFVDPTNPNILKQPVEFRNGVLYIREAQIDNANIQNATIAGEKLELNAISLTQEWTSNNYSGFNTTAYVYFSNAAIITGPIPAGTKVQLTLSIEQSGSDGKEIRFRVERVGPDGTNYLTVTPTMGCADSGRTCQAWTWTDQVPVQGNYTFNLQFTRERSVTIHNAHYVGLIQKR
jgi:hypothetical protein